MDLMITKKYPWKGIKKLNFMGYNLSEDFAMIGFVISLSPQTRLDDYKVIYTGGIKIENEDGTISYPNMPFFMLDVGGKRFLSLPLYSIPDSRYPHRFLYPASKPTNGYSIPLTIKKGMKIDAIIEYPLHKVPLLSGKDNSITLQMIGMENR